LQRADGRAGAGARASVDARVAALVARHERALMRVALHWSLCRDDALDAYQRALEIYVRRVDSLDPATESAWMRVVVKNEALAVRRQRADALPDGDLDADAEQADPQRPVDELLAGRERVARSREALTRLKPDEAKALVLKAQGMSYREIGESLSWTYTKVNRCITEGRARFLKAYAEIEAGEVCERFAPTLAALAGGTASAEALLELRPHIRNCPACRATVRDLHATRFGRLAALWPIPALVGPLRWVTGRLGGGHGDAIVLGPGSADVPGADAIALGPGRNVPGADAIALGPDPASPDLSPLDGVPDLYDALSPLNFPGVDRAGRLLDLKTQLWSWVHRLQSSDVAVSAQVAASAGGGGRIATVGAVIGLCLSGVGAGTVCIVSGIVENPFAPPHRPAHTAPRARPQVVATPLPASRQPAVRPAATPAPMATPRPAARKRDDDRRVGARSGGTASATDPTAHEQPPAAPAPTGATQDFSPETIAPAAPAAPAQAPTTGGGEFTP
jgi:RNA polymerase sigma factor (sigma-70 family)